MFLILSKRLWKFQGACGPEQLRVVICNAVPKGATAHLGSDETAKYAAFHQLIPDVLHAILKCPKNGGCTELTKKDTWSSDGHLTNISNKQARKYRNFTFSDRYGFKICEKLKLPTRAKNITCWDSVIFLKSTHLVHPCKPHHGGTPMENSVASWGVRYTRLTSTNVENVERGRSIILINGFGFSNSPWVVRSIF